MNAGAEDVRITLNARKEGTLGLGNRKVLDLDVHVRKVTSFFSFLTALARRDGAFVRPKESERVREERGEKEVRACGRVVRTTLSNDATSHELVSEHRVAVPNLYYIRLDS
jgi:hypothetical protein